MKLTMEIQGHSTSEVDSRKNPGQKVTLTAIWGVDNHNRYARAVMFDQVAIALNNKLATLAGGEVLSTKRIAVVLDGEWEQRVVKTAEGEKRFRQFTSNEFNILDGMALEGARLRRDAVLALDKAEKLRKNGQLALAYETAAQFVANYAGVPLELEQFLADAAADDAEFGAVVTETNPEAIAAAHFAKHDVGIADAVSKQTADATAAEEPVAETDEQSPMDFGTSDEELGATENVEIDDVVEEDAISLEAAPETVENDVLDDAPSETAVADTQEQAPVERAAPAPLANASPFASRSPFAASPPFGGSKPFSRPEMPREAAQPTARPATSSSFTASPSPFGPRR